MWNGCANSFQSKPFAFLDCKIQALGLVMNLKWSRPQWQAWFPVHACWGVVQGAKIMVESCRFGAQGSCDFLTCRTLDVFGAKSVPEGMYWMYSDVRDVRLVLDPWRWPGYFWMCFHLALRAHTWSPKLHVTVKQWVTSHKEGFSMHKHCVSVLLDLGLLVWLSVDLIPQCRRYRWLTKHTGREALRRTAKLE